MDLSTEYSDKLVLNLTEDNFSSFSKQQLYDCILKLESNLIPFVKFPESEKKSKQTYFKFQELLKVSKSLGEQVKYLSNQKTEGSNLDIDEEIDWFVNWVEAQ